MAYVVAHDGQSRVVRVLCVLKGCAAKGLSYLLSKVKVYAYWIHLQGILIGRGVAMVLW